MRSFLFRKRHLMALLLFTNLIFAVLYFRFLAGEAVYLYLDIGSDSTYASFPILTLLTRLFHGGDFSAFHAEAGFGFDTTPLLLKYLNPVKLPLLFFTEETLPSGLVVALFLQTNVLALASRGCFRRLQDNEWAASAAALVWSFSGYVTLWSQNLTFGSSLAAFTFCMYLLIRALKSPTLRSWLALAAGLALSAVTDYFFTWMTLLYIPVFLLFYSLFAERSLRRFPRFLLFFLSSGIPAVLLAAYPLTQIAAGFLRSARTSDAAGKFSGPVFQSKKTLITILGRFFSVNASGVGSSFTGAFNYYEAAALSSSILILFAIVYFLAKSKTRIGMCAGLAAAFFTLSLRGAARLLDFNSGTQRCSFLIAFSGVIVCALFLGELFTKPDGKALVLSAVFAPLVALCAAFLFIKKAPGFGITVYTRAFKEALLFAAVCSAFLISVFFLKHRTRRIHRFLVPAMLFMLSSELIVMNYDTLYFREYVPSSGYADVAGAHGTADAIDSLRSRGEEEPGELYRVAAASSSEEANVGMLLGFPASSVYYNTTPAANEELLRTLGTSRRSASHYLLSWYDGMAFPLAGGRYAVTPDDGLLCHTPPASLYEKTDAAGGKTVWRLKNALPFGWLYEDEEDLRKFEAMSAPERQLLLTRAYVRSGKSASGSAEKESSLETALYRKTDLIPQLTDYQNLSSERDGGALILRRTAADPHVRADLGRSAEGVTRMLYLRAEDLPGSGIVSFQIYLIREGSEADAEDVITFYMSGDTPEASVTLPDECASVRLDLPENRKEIRLSAFDLLEYRDLPEAFSALASTKISDIRFSGGMYEASVSSEKGGMLCIPLLYSDSWSAEADGSPVDVENINGGFTGVLIPAGDVHVKLAWHRPFAAASAAVSVCSIVLWFILFFLV